MARWVSLYKEGHLILEWLADGESHEESDGEDAVKEGEALRPPLRRRDVGDVRVAAQKEHHVASRAVLQALNVNLVMALISFINPVMVPENFKLTSWHCLGHCYGEKK